MLAQGRMTHEHVEMRIRVVQENMDSVLREGTMEIEMNFTKPKAENSNNTGRSRKSGCSAGATVLPREASDSATYCRRKQASGVREKLDGKGASLSEKPSRGHGPKGANAGAAKSIRLNAEYVSVPGWVASSRAFNFTAGTLADLGGRSPAASSAVNANANERGPDSRRSLRGADSCSASSDVEPPRKPDRTWRAPRARAAETAEPRLSPGTSCAMRGQAPSSPVGEVETNCPYCGLKAL